MKKGTVKSFNEAIGFGFITPGDGSSDLFVHSNGLTDTTRESNSMEHEVEQGRKGLNAYNIKLA